MTTVQYVLLLVLSVAAAVAVLSLLYYMPETSPPPLQPWLELRPVANGTFDVYLRGAERGFLWVNGMYAGSASEGERVARVKCGDKLELLAEARGVRLSLSGVVKCGKPPVSSAGRSSRVSSANAIADRLGKSLENSGDAELKAYISKCWADGANIYAEVVVDFRGYYRLEGVEGAAIREMRSPAHGPAPLVVVVHNFYDRNFRGSVKLRIFSRPYAASAADFDGGRSVTLSFSTALIEDTTASFGDETHAFYLNGTLLGRCTSERVEETAAFKRYELEEDVVVEQWEVSACLETGGPTIRATYYYYPRGAKAVSTIGNGTCRDVGVYVETPHGRYKVDIGNLAFIFSSLRLADAIGISPGELVKWGVKWTEGVRVLGQIYRVVERYENYTFAYTHIRKEGNTTRIWTALPSIPGIWLGGVTGIAPFRAVNATRIS